MTIIPAGAAEIPLVRDLFLEYSQTLGIDLCFELAGAPFLELELDR